MSLVRAWSAFGRWSAVPIAVAFYAAAVAAGVLLPEGTSSWVGLGLLATLIAYCVARPSDGYDAFAYVAAPGAASQVADDVLGLPVWLGLLVLPLSLLGLRSLDARTGGEADGTGAGVVGGEDVAAAAGATGGEGVAAGAGATEDTGVAAGEGAADRESGLAG